MDDVDKYIMKYHSDLYSCVKGMPIELWALPRIVKDTPGELILVDFTQKRVISREKM